MQEQIAMKLIKLLPLLLMVTGCNAYATKPEIEYSPEFLNCVADFGEAYQTKPDSCHKVPKCVDAALAIWSTTVKE